MTPAVRYTGSGSVGGGTVAMPRAPVQVGEPIPTGPTVFSVCPRTLSGLWDEYQNGAGGRKPAREFTRAKRGQNNVKFKYSSRLIV